MTLNNHVHFELENDMKIIEGENEVVGHVKISRLPL